MKPSLPETLPGLVAAAELLGIDLVKADYSRVPSGDGKQGTPRDLEVDIKVEVARRESYEKEALSYLCTALASWMEPTTSADIANAGVMFRVAYRLKGIERSLTDAELDAFGDEVALHQAWPFLRERLKSFSIELGLPPLVLPLRQRAQLAPASASPTDG
jgi:hypothetical protein